MSVEETTRLDKEFMSAWNAHDPDRAIALLSDDAVWEDVASPERMRSKSAIRDYMQSWFTAFPDMNAVEKNQVVAGDKLAVEVEFTGTNTGPMRMGGSTIPATGKRVTGHGTYFARVLDGKIAEIHTYPDVAGMMMQLGLMPTGGTS